MSSKNGTDPTKMDTDFGKKSHGDSSDFKEEMTVLNEDFLSCLQDAVKGTPDACLAPIVMDYMEYLMELIVTKNPNLLGGDRNFLQKGASAKDFSNVGRFFQKLKSDSFNAPTFTGLELFHSAGSNPVSSTAPKSSNTFTFTSTAIATPVSTSSSSTSNNPNSGITFASAKNIPSTTSSTQGISPFNRQTTVTSVNWGSGSMPWETVKVPPVTATNEVSKTTAIPSIAPVSTTSTSFTSFATPTFAFGTKPDANAIFGSSSNPPANTPVVPAPAFASTFSFSSNFNTAPQASTAPVNGSTATNNDDSDDEAPPKPDHKPVIEDDSVFTQRVKLFELEDKKYKDLGIGNLFIKKLQTGKHQLVIRADTSLGTILMNTVLNASMPMKILKPANILASIPSTEGKVKTYIFRVKDADMGNELLQNLEKFKEES